MLLSVTTLIMLRKLLGLEN